MNNQDFKIILVDNGSKDGSVEWINEHYPETIIIRNKRNYGFAKANNIGIKVALKAGAEYIGFLNTDMVVDENWLSELLKTLKEKTDVGIVCSKILFMDIPWLINSTGIITNIDMYSRDRDFGRVDTVITEERETIGASGGAMLVRSEVFKKIGMFDTIFFSYYEDTDLSFRLRRYTHFKIVNNPRSIVWHKMWGSTRNNPQFREFFLSRNNYIMIYKYLPLIKIPFHALRIFKVRAKRKFYRDDVLQEYRAFLSAAYVFIPSFLKRLYLDMRFGIHYGYLKMLEDTKGIPISLPFPPDYTERRERFFPEKLPVRILFGINDKYIGKNWSILHKQKEELRYRTIEGDYADVYLSYGKNSGYLQIHAKWGGRLKVYFEDKSIGEYSGNNEWDTIAAHIIIKKKKKYYKIRIEGRDAMVNEVALIDSKSPMLRVEV